MRHATRKAVFQHLIAGAVFFALGHFYARRFGDTGDGRIRSNFASSLDPDHADRAELVEAGLDSTLKSHKASLFLKKENLNSHSTIAMLPMSPHNL